MLRVGFLASHHASSAQAIVRAARDGALAVDPRVLICNNGDAPALGWARASGLDTHHLSSRTHPEPRDLDDAISRALEQASVDLVLLSGYMKRIGPATLARFRNRILNLHPALLPDFGGRGMYGMAVHEAVIAAGARTTGVSVQIIDADYDTGPVLLQMRLPIGEDETPAQLQRRVAAIEPAAYVATLEAIVGGAIDLDDVAPGGWRPIVRDAPEPGGSGYLDLLRAASRTNGSLLCVGLDPDPARIGGGADEAFKHCRRVVEQTADLVCCYKPNAAFWEQYGPSGWDALARLRDEIPDGIPVLLDAKRADVGHTMDAYAQAVFGAMRMSAATVHAYHGAETLERFAAWRDRGVYVVAVSSNPGGADLQQLQSDGRPVYEHVAELAAAANGLTGNVGVVVGATQPEHAARIRRRFPDMPFLMPGVGGQGADVDAAVAAAYTGDPASCLLSASRSVLYASDPRAAAGALRDQIAAGIARL